ncbi:MAG: hypothetical protein ABEH78_07950 [Haloferacaceae archaeon]
MAMDFGDAFDGVSDTENWMNAAAVLAGLGVSVVMKNGIDSRFDAPDEVYGLVTAGAGYALDYPMVATGGLGYTGMKLAGRVGLKDRVENAGA